MRAARRAWNVAFRRQPTLVPAINPFARPGLERTEGQNFAANRGQFRAFVAAADRLGIRALARPR